jgi:hypothetical protein
MERQVFTTQRRDAHAILCDGRTSGIRSGVACEEINLLLILDQEFIHRSTLSMNVISRQRDENR